MTELEIKIAALEQAKTELAVAQAVRSELSDIGGSTYPVVIAKAQAHGAVVGLQQRITTLEQEIKQEIELDAPLSRYPDLSPPELPSL